MDADRDVDEEQMSHFGDGTECCGAPHIQTGASPASPSIQERLRKEATLGTPSPLLRAAADRLDSLEEALREIEGLSDLPHSPIKRIARALLSPQGTEREDCLVRPCPDHPSAPQGTDEAGR